MEILIFNNMGIFNKLAHAVATVVMNDRWPIPWHACMMAPSPGTPMISDCAGV